MHELQIHKLNNCKMARPRSICFTLNNFTPEELTHLQTSIDNGHYKYIVFQQERGAAGTPHLQGYAQRDRPTSFAAWKGFIGGRIHIEATRGTPQQNRDYCTKDADRIPGTLVVEHGEIPVPGERRDLSAFVEACKDPSKSLTDLIDEHGDSFLRYNRGALAIRSAFASVRTFKTRIFWFYGSTGSGKTRAAHEIAPGAYWKQNSPWWCGYDPLTHDDVIIDEYRCDFSKFTFLLSLFDRYPLIVQPKGGNLNFRSRRIFVTTPLDPRATWNTRSDENIQQLLRRIECIVEFLPAGVRRIHKGDLSDYELLGVVPANAGDPRPTQEEEGQDPDPVELEEARRMRARIDTFNV